MLLVMTMLLVVTLLLMLLRLQLLLRAGGPVRVLLHMCFMRAAQLRFSQTQKMGDGWMCPRTCMHNVQCACACASTGERTTQQVACRHTVYAREAATNRVNPAASRAASRAA